MTAADDKGVQTKDSIKGGSLTTASTNLISDAGTVITNGPAAATKTKCIAAAGPIMDYQGNTALLIMKLREADLLLLKILTVTDAGDASKAGITAVEHALTGGGSPSGTCIAALKTAIATGPSAASKALAIAAAGPIMDYAGNLSVALQKLQDASQLLVQIINATDSGDTSLTQLNNINSALS